jgi:glycine cleavage system H protein
MPSTRFSKEHEWVRIDGDAAVCGITDYAQKALGDIVYVELPAIGKKVKQGESVAVVESAKAASEVYAPIDGEVIAVNDNLSSNPGIVNAAAASTGWFFKLKAADAAQASGLMDEATYQNYLKGLLAG